MTVEEFCSTRCKTCTEQHCCVDFEPSCALSRKLKIELEAADE